jgi:flagellar biosynthesis protein FlhB
VKPTGLLFQISKSNPTSKIKHYFDKNNVVQLLNSINNLVIFVVELNLKLLKWICSWLVQFEP